MKTDSLLRRLQAVKDKLAQDPLIVRAEFPDGSERELPVREAVAQGCVNACFRVVSGSSLRDLDFILEQTRQKAFEEVLCNDV